MNIEYDASQNRAITYHYTPSAPAAIIFIAVFGINTIGHFVEMSRLRTAYFLPLTFGCLMETFGYYGRYWSHSDPNNFKAYIMQLLLILIAPIFIAATVYMSLGRIVQALSSDSLLAIRPRWFTKLSILFDIICFITQIAGAGMQSTTSKHVQDIGRVVVIIGLVLQAVVFVFFITATWRFMRRYGGDVKAHSGPFGWKSYLRVILAASFCVLLRNIVRVAEFAEGPAGVVNAHEVFIYLFDALLLAVVATLLLVFHPGRLQRVVKMGMEGLMAEATGARGSETEVLKA